MFLSPASPDQLLPYAIGFIIFLFAFIAKWLNDFRRHRNSENQIELKMKAQDAKYQEQLQNTITELNGKYAAQTEFYSKMLEAEREESRKLIERIAVLEHQVNQVLDDKRRAEEQRDKAFEEAKALRIERDSLKGEVMRLTLELDSTSDSYDSVIKKHTEEINTLKQQIKTYKEIPTHE